MVFIHSFRTMSLQILAVLLAVSQPSHASPSMAAWWTARGPQLLVQNSTTLAIQYSSCNSNDTPIYPYDQPNVLPLMPAFNPKNGTALAGVGWWTGQTTMASMWYQDDHNALVNGVFQCDWTTGKFVSQGSYIISNDLPSVHSQTGLAALLLGSTAGYRVYYHDEKMTVNEIGYTPATGWQNRQRRVSPDPPVSTAIHAAFTGNNNISVVTPRDSENIEVTRYNSDGSWHISTFPRPLSGNPTTDSNSNGGTTTLNTTVHLDFTLPHYGAPRGIGISIDAAFTRTVYYIGTDRNLYAASNVHFVWSLQGNTSTLFWPQADEPNAPLAVASDFTSSQVRIYYYVQGALTELKFDKDGSWKQAAAVPTFNATAQVDVPATTDGPGNNSTMTPPAGVGTADAGLSSGAKAGIGVGVTLGVLAIAGVLGAIFFFRRREQRELQQQQQQQQQQQADMAEQSGTAPGNAAGLSPPQPGPAVLYDAHGNPVYDTNGNPIYDPRYGTTPPYGGSPPPGVEGYVGDQKKYPEVQSMAQLDGRELRQELEGPRPMYELPDQAYSHELVGDQARGDLNGHGNGNGAVR